MEVTEDAIAQTKYSIVLIDIKSNKNQFHSSRGKFNRPVKTSIQVPLNQIIHQLQP